MTVTNYAQTFESVLQEKYAVESKSEGLSTNPAQVRFSGAQIVQVPEIKLGGYGDHDRSTAGFNTSALSNAYVPYKLAFDRDVEFFIDPMDIDETNQALSIANIQNAFEEDVAIPERDKYRFSKLYKEAKAKGVTIDTTALTVANVLGKFDDLMEAMDEAEVKEEGRLLYVTPKVYKLLKTAEGIQRTIEITGRNTKEANRTIHSLDDVEIIKVPSSRMKSAYKDTGSGVDRAYTATSDAVQINMILVDPSCVLAIDKYAYIRTFSPGSDSRTADGYIYQNRKYGDLFLIEAKKAGVAIVADAAA